jgi:hypothetical protein
MRKRNSITSKFISIKEKPRHYKDKTYKAAPTTDNATDRPIPTVAHM